MDKGNGMSKHTPGPWCLRDRGGNVCIAGTDLDLGTSFVAYCRYDGKPLNARQKANARLIAAAPDLLEACRQALQYISADEVSHGRQFGAGNALRAAIKKATQ